MELFDNFRVDANSRVQRVNGHSAVAAAAYQARARLFDERTGETFDYSRKGGVVHTEIVMPAGVLLQWDRAELWNSVEARDTRKNACLARKIVMSLPCEATSDERLIIARNWAKFLASRNYVAVDFAIHEPDETGDRRNWHVHFLVSTRQIGPQGLGGKAPLELSRAQQVAHGYPVGKAAFRALRAGLAENFNETCLELGLDLYADPRSYADRGLDILPTTHLGRAAVALERASKPSDRIEDHRAALAEMRARFDANPDLMLDILVEKSATFTRRDVNRLIARYAKDPAEAARLRDKLMGLARIVELGVLRKAGARSDIHYSTQAMIDLEAAMLRSARRLASRQGHHVASGDIARALTGRPLTNEQACAVRALLESTGLSILVGDAGAGKTFALAAAVAAWRWSGRPVYGGAPTGKAADVLHKSIGVRCETLHFWVRAWESGRDLLEHGSVLVIDEAGMVDSALMARVLLEAEKRNIKIVAVGDDKQLTAVSAGAPFRVLIERFGAAELKEIRRQQDPVQAQASRELARGSVGKAFATYRALGLIESSAPTRDEACAQIARDWLASAAQGGSPVIMTHTNRDRLAIGDMIRGALKAQGQLTQERIFETDSGPRAFAPGERIVFLKNARKDGLWNGTTGRVESIEDGLVVRTDDGERITVPDNYTAFDHGYALTVHKSQGISVDECLVLASAGMDRRLAYVAMTRHKKKVRLYTNVEEFGAGGRRLAARLWRPSAKHSTLDFAAHRGIAGDAQAEAEDRTALMRIARAIARLRRLLARKLARACAQLKRDAQALAETQRAALAASEARQKAASTLSAAPAIPYPPAPEDAAGERTLPQSPRAASPPAPASPPAAQAPGPAQGAGAVTPEPVLPVFFDAGRMAAYLKQGDHLRTRRCEDVSFHVLANLMTTDPRAGAIEAQILNPRNASPSADIPEPQPAPGEPPNVGYLRLRNWIIRRLDANLPLLPALMSWAAFADRHREALMGAPGLPRPEVATLAQAHRAKPQAGVLSEGQLKDPIFAFKENMNHFQEYAPRAPAFGEILAAQNAQLLDKIHQSSALAPHINATARRLEQEFDRMRHRVEGMPGGHGPLVPAKDRGPGRGP